MLGSDGGGKIFFGFGVVKLGRNLFILVGGYFFWLRGRNYM